MLFDIHEPGQSPMPHQSGDQAVGIDLGTTNSVIAFSENGFAEAVKPHGESSLIPSVIAYSGGGEIVAGEAAMKKLGAEGWTVIRSIKRLMGRGAEDVKSLDGVLPYELVRRPMQDSTGMARLRLPGGGEVTPVEVSAEILRAIKKRAEEALGGEVSKAVITVPSYFDDAARAATKDAAKLAGLEVLRLINEPTAAALAYGLDNGSEGLFAVYDLGGGTFDISILKMEKGVFQVIATGGDAALGGDDFDHALVRRLMQSNTETQAGNQESACDESALAFKDATLAEFALNEVGSGALDSSSAARLIVQAKAVKEELSVADRAEIEFGGKSVSINKAQFEELIKPLVARTIAACRNALDDAGVSPKEIEGVIMVGGSTRVPLVRKMVGELFGPKLLTDLNPDEVVAVGAAIQAEALTRGGNNLLLDVTPLSLGIETMGGIVEKLIYRNTPIPVSVSQEFTTYKDGQQGMVIHALQGEREMVDQCRSLARFELSGIPPMPAGMARIKVTYTVDADGLLTVSAREEVTETEQKVEVKPSYGLSFEEIEKMLTASMENARSDITTRLLAESRVEAMRMLMALDNALKNDSALLSAAEKEVITRAADELRASLKGDDRDEIDYLVQQLEKASAEFATRRVNRDIGEALRGKGIEEIGIRGLGSGGS